MSLVPHGIEPLGRCEPASYAQVLMGNFSCCRMGHTLPDGTPIPCDRVALTRVVETVHRRKCRALRSSGELPSWRKTLALRWVYLQGAPAEALAPPSPALAPSPSLSPCAPMVRRKGTADPPSNQRWGAVGGPSWVVRQRVGACGVPPPPPSTPSPSSAADEPLPAAAAAGAAGVCGGAECGVALALDAYCKYTDPVSTFLRKYGFAHVREAVEFHMTPLHYAAYENSAEAVRMLIAANADAEARDAHPTDLRMGGCTPLFLACMQGCTSSAAALLRCGASPNQLGGSNTPPLTCAVICERPEIVQLLLSASAAVDACAGGDTMQRYRGCTALHAALRTGNTRVIRVLVGAGADIDACVVPYEGGPSELFGKSAREIAHATGGEVGDALEGRAGLCARG